MPNKWLVLTEFPSTVEAELAAARLRDVGLHVMLNSPASGLFGGGFSGMVVQGVKLLVPASELDQAKAALDLSA